MRSSRSQSSNYNFLSPNVRSVGVRGPGSLSCIRHRDKSPGDLAWDRSKSVIFGDKKIYWKVRGTR
jgi:hypothetical protein